MKSMSPDALDALENGCVVAGAVRFATSPVVALWSGHAEIEIDGDTYIPCGEHGMIRATAGSVGSAAEGIEIELTNIPDEAYPALETAALRGVQVRIYRLIFDADGRELLDASVHARGRVDYVVKNWQAGGASTISITVDGSARGLGRRNGRMRSDADQRLILSTDGGLKHISYAGDRTLYWGGQRPSRARNGIPNAGGGYRGEIGGDGLQGRDHH